MFLFIIYLIYLEISPILAYLYSWFSNENYAYSWAKLCLKFAGCSVTFAKTSHPLALYEPNGCLFLSTNEDLYTTAIDTYLTGGWALVIAPYSYITNRQRENAITQNKLQDAETILAKSNYINLLAYPEIYKEDDYEYRVSHFTSLAWTKQMAIQVIMCNNKERVLDFKKAEANYGLELYCYRSEVIKPQYFTTLDEFSCYVELVWFEAEDKLRENTNLTSKF
jgi:hypothetical protein